MHKYNTSTYIACPVFDESREWSISCGSPGQNTVLIQYAHSTNVTNHTKTQHHDSMTGGRRGRCCSCRGQPPNHEVTRPCVERLASISSILFWGDAFYSSSNTTISDHWYLYVYIIVLFVLAHFIHTDFITRVPQSRPLPSETNTTYYIPYSTAGTCIIISLAYRVCTLTPSATRERDPRLLQYTPVYLSTPEYIEILTMSHGTYWRLLQPQKTRKHLPLLAAIHHFLPSSSQVSNIHLPEQP